MSTSGSRGEPRAHTFQPLWPSVWPSAPVTFPDEHYRTWGAEPSEGNQNPGPALALSMAWAARKEEVGQPGGRLCATSCLGPLSVLKSWWPQGWEALTPVTPTLLRASEVWCLRSCPPRSALCPFCPLGAVLVVAVELTGVGTPHPDL